MTNHIKPEVEESKTPHGWGVHLRNVVELDGVSGFILYDPERPPHEVSYSGKGESLDLDEVQARLLYARLGEIFEKRDAPLVKRFLARRPYYSAEHVKMIAQKSAENGLPFCHTCDDWHEEGDPHSDIEVR